MKMESIKIEVELNSGQLELIAQRAAMIIQEKPKETKELNKTIKAFTVKEAASFISISPRTVREHCKNGIITASKSGKSYLITQESLNKYLTKHD